MPTACDHAGPRSGAATLKGRCGVVFLALSCLRWTVTNYHLAATADSEHAHSRQAHRSLCVQDRLHISSSTAMGPQVCTQRKCPARTHHAECVRRVQTRVAARQARLGRGSWGWFGVSGRASSHDGLDSRARLVRSRASARPWDLAPPPRPPGGPRRLEKAAECGLLHDLLFVPGRRDRVVLASDWGEQDVVYAVIPPCIHSLTANRPSVSSPNCSARDGK